MLETGCVNAALCIAALSSSFQALSLVLYVCTACLSLNCSLPGFYQTPQCCAVVFTCRVVSSITYWSFVFFIFILLSLNKFSFFIMLIHSHPYLYRHGSLMSCLFCMQLKYGITLIFITKYFTCFRKAESQEFWVTVHSIETKSPAGKTLSIYLWNFSVVWFDAALFSSERLACHANYNIAFIVFKTAFPYLLLWRTRLCSTVTSL